jgi:hypothetical protein
MLIFIIGEPGLLFHPQTWHGAAFLTRHQSI